MRWRDASIVRRLVVLAMLAGLVPGLLGVLLVRTLEERALRAEAADRNEAVALRTAATIDGRISALTDQLQLLGSLPAVATMSDAADDDLSVALRVSDELDRLVLHDRVGRAVAATASAELVRPEDLPRRPLDRRLPRVAVVRPSGGMPVLELAVPVEDPPGTMVGTLVGQVPLAIITPEIEGNLLGSGRGALLVAGDGGLVAHRDVDRVRDGEDYPLADAMTSGVRSDAPGGPLLVAGAPLTALDGWVVVEQPEHVALAPADVTIDGVTTVLLAVVAAIVTAVILAGRRLLRPVAGLVDAVGRLERGERAVRVPTGAAAEVGALAEGFNRMAGALDERREQLEAAEAAARNSEERLRLLVEGVEDYAIVLLDRDGRIRSWNTGARRLLGYDAADALDRPFADVFAVAGDVGADPLLEASVARRGATEGWCRRGDGSRFWARTVATALTDEDGEPYGYAVVVQDLTDRQAARTALEEALQREQQAAEELRRTSELKDEFLAIATHEIRTPLAAILGASALLSSGWDELEEADKLRFRDMVSTHAQDMRLIVDRLLDFTRLQAGRAELVSERFDLAEELQRSVEVLARQLDGHELEVVAPARQVELDREVLRHVVTNLLSNAAKFSPAGSPIRLTAEVADTRLVVSVRDEGTGIPIEDHESVFELFRQSSTHNPTKRGTGVGLAIVKRYVELAGGTVALDSAPGRGSTFTVTLPVGLDWNAESPVGNTPGPEIDPPTDPSLRRTP